jgi:hypothetical protein
MSVTKTDWFIPPVKIIGVYSEDDMKPINILCERNAEFLNIKAGGVYCNPTPD